MSHVDEVMKFSTRENFRRWLQENCMSDAGREKRLAWMVDRLNKNQKPM